MKHKPLDPYVILQTMVDTTSQVQVAKQLGIARSHINAVYNGKKRMGKALLDAIGIEAVTVVTYRHKS